VSSRAPGPAAAPGAMQADAIPGTADKAASATQVITVTNPLTADFTFSPTTATTVRFDATPSVSANGNSISSYAWTFGDGDTATGQTATNVFPTASTFVVRLTITDSTGNTATVTKNVTVTAP
jgi:hypothetical protein